MFYSISLYREDPLINLNYAVLLFNTGDRSGAAKQFMLYQSKLRKLQGKQPDLDPEVIDSEKHGVTDSWTFLACRSLLLFMFLSPCPPFLSISPAFSLSLSPRWRKLVKSWPQSFKLETATT